MDCEREVHYTGVRKRVSGRYCAYIIDNHIHHCLGTFDTPEQAAVAYDAAARSLRGSMARTNFPSVVGASNAIKKRQYRGGRKRGRSTFATPKEAGGSGGKVVEAARVETMLFSDIIRRGLPVDLNEPPPPWLE